MNPKDVLQSRPTKVCMLGLGPSANAYWLEQATWDTTPPWQEVWAINRASSAFACDVQWNMHDLRDLAREHPNEDLRLRRSHMPIITVAEYPEYPTSVAYPIREVLEFLGHDILNSTPAYMVAYAMMIGVKHLYLYGMDFHYVNIDRAEAGGQGMAYLLGMCQTMGIQYKIPNTSSLLDAYKARLVRVTGQPDLPMRPLYGYGVTQDPRIPAGAQVISLEPQSQPMSAHQPRYALGEGGEGDQVKAPVLQGGPDGVQSADPRPAEAAR